MASFEPFEIKKTDESNEVFSVGEISVPEYALFCSQPCSLIINQNDIRIELSSDRMSGPVEVTFRLPGEILGASKKNGLYTVKLKDNVATYPFKST